MNKQPNISAREEIRELLHNRWDKFSGTVHYNGSVYRMEHRDVMYNTEDGWKIKLDYDGHNATFDALCMLDQLSNKYIQKDIYKRYRKNDK